MKIAVMVGLLMSLVSCSSTVVQKVSAKPKHAPVGYVQKGIIKYLNNGADWIIEKRREDAFEKMYASCNGPDYKILWEGTEKEGRMMNPNIFGGFSEMGYNYMYIEYQCLSDADRAAASK